MAEGNYLGHVGLPLLQVLLQVGSKHAVTGMDVVSVGAAAADLSYESLFSERFVHSLDQRLR